jgi:hypothetical protein
VVPGPQNAFTDDELSSLKHIVDRGDSVLVMMTDGGEERMNTNINFFLEEYGIVVNNGRKVIFILMVNLYDYYLCGISRKLLRSLPEGFQGIYIHTTHALSLKG